MRGHEITMLKPADEKIIKISKEIYLVGLWILSFSSGSDPARLQCKRASLSPATDGTGDCGFIFQLNVISRVDYKCFLVCCTLAQRQPTAAFTARTTSCTIDNQLLSPCLLLINHSKLLLTASYPPLPSVQASRRVLRFSSGLIEIYNQPALIHRKRCCGAVSRARSVIIIIILY